MVKARIIRFMKINKKIDIKNWIARLCIAYPFLYEVAVMVSESIGRRMSLLMIALLLFEMSRDLTKKDCLGMFFIVLFSLINAIRFGISYVLHQDFYGIVFLLIIFLYYSNKKRMVRLEENVLNECFSNTIVLLFYFALIISIFFFDGLQTSAEWGVSIPMLYGPYGLPHTLAYSLIAIYAINSILWHRYNKRTYLFLMGITTICLIWTGVRSAILVSILMIFFDYCSIKDNIKKTIVVLVAGIVFLYLFLFTDLIVSNPVVQKTLNALRKGSGITNGRMDFISYLWDFFNDTASISEKVFGISMQGLRQYMMQRYGIEIHAHNDIMNTLVGMGIIGLLVFTIFLFLFCMFKHSKKKTISVFLILFLLAFFNGLYMYVGFVPCVPIIYVYINCLDGNKHHKNHILNYS